MPGDSEPPGAERGESASEPPIAGESDSEQAEGETASVSEYLAAELDALRLTLEARKQTEGEESGEDPPAGSDPPNPVPPPS